MVTFWYVRACNPSIRLVQGPDMFVTVDTDHRCRHVVFPWVHTATRPIAQGCAENLRQDIPTKHAREPWVATP